MVSFNEFILSILIERLYCALASAPDPGRIIPVQEHSFCTQRAYTLEGEIEINYN